MLLQHLISLQQYLRLKCLQRNYSNYRHLSASADEISNQLQYKNALVHVFLLMCTLRVWVCKLLDWLKHLLHSEHLYGFSPVWTLVWHFRLPDKRNALLHTWHLYGLSPVWTLLWTVNVARVSQHFPHSVHLNIPMCVFMCLFNPRVLLYPLPQSVHTHGFDLSSLLSALVFTSINLPVDKQNSKY